MGNIGASNISTSDLSVYQSAVTKISQELNNLVSNASSIDLQSTQNMIFQNGNTNRCTSGTIYEDRLNCLTQCDSLASKGIIDQSGILQCRTDCSTIFADCTPEEILAMEAQINCNISIGQSSTQSATTTQFAETTTNASMTSAISSQFQSQIDKTINQTNKDLNFGQSNLSSERTSLSQSILNDVMNAITNNSQNLSTSSLTNDQTVTFINQGIINCSGCGAKPPISSLLVPGVAPLPTTTVPTSTSSTGDCTLQITQTNAQNVVTAQKATAALQSIFDNTIANELASKYTLAVSQTNAGVNLLDVLLPIIIMVVAVVAILWIGTGTVKGVLNSEFIKIMAIMIFIVVIIAGLIFAGLVIDCQLMSTIGGPDSCKHSTTSPTPTPTPGPSSNSQSPSNTPSTTPTPSPSPVPNSACPPNSSQYPNNACSYGTLGTNNYSQCAIASGSANPSTTCVWNYNNNGIYCGPC